MMTKSQSEHKRELIILLDYLKDIFNNSQKQKTIEKFPKYFSEIIIIYQNCFL